jgi:predicted dienelactone hydrolase
MWYPAAADATGDTAFTTFLRDGRTQVTLEGRAMRDAAPAAGSEPLPLVILSHGYPGNRFLMSHLAENLASKGYVVAAIDHTDSVYQQQGPFASTLVNRPLDQLFVLNEMARLNADAGFALSGMIDANNTGLIGYSMGGYGALVTAGAGLTDRVMGFAPHGALEIHRQGSETHEALPDPRIRTAVAIAPWGMQHGFWDAEGLAGIDIPMLFIAGSNDTTSQYETGVRAAWEGAVSSDRALLTFDGGGHNIVAPIPAPVESFDVGVSGHYTDAVWDTVFMNNVGQHFITAWLDLLLKGDLSMQDYLTLAAIGGDNAWLGFAEGTNAGLRWETIDALRDTTPAPVPLPAAAWMLLAGLGALGAVRRMKHPA